MLIGSHVRTWFGPIAGLIRSEEGSIAALIGLGLPVFLGLAALSMDVSQWYDEKRTLQTAADAAAVGAATELTDGRSATMTTQASADALRNGVPIVAGTTITLNSPPQSGPNLGNAKAVEVIITRQAHRTFSGSLFGTDPLVRVRAVALIGDPGNYCVLGLSEVNVAILVSGSTDVVLDCGVAANADLRMNGNQAELTATSATISGSVTGFEQNLDVPPGATQEGAPTTDDPYSALSLPSPLPGAGTVSGSAPKTYSPGTYNSEINITGGNVVFNPGVYVLNNAPMKITGGNITGTGVTFIFTGTAPNNVGGIDFSGNGTLTLKAPTSGAYEGVAFYQSASAGTSNVNKINGTSNFKITGAVYFPKQEVQFQGDNTSGGGGCTQIVADKVTFTGNSTLGYSCEGTGVRPINAARVALVE